MAKKLTLEEQVKLLEERVAKLEAIIKDTRPTVPRVIGVVHDQGTRRMG